MGNVRAASICAAKSLSHFAVHLREVALLGSGRFFAAGAPSGRRVKMGQCPVVCVAGGTCFSCRKFIHEFVLE